MHSKQFNKINMEWKAWKQGNITEGKCSKCCGNEWILCKGGVADDTASGKQGMKWKFCQQNDNSRTHQKMHGWPVGWEEARLNPADFSGWNKWCLEERPAKKGAQRRHWNQTYLQETAFLEVEKHLQIENQNRRSVQHDKRSEQIDSYQLWLPASEARSIGFGIWHTHILNWSQHSEGKILIRSRVIFDIRT